MGSRLNPTDLLGTVWYENEVLLCQDTLAGSTVAMGNAQGQHHCTGTQTRYRASSVLDWLQLRHSHTLQLSLLPDFLTAAKQC